MWDTLCDDDNNVQLWFWCTVLKAKRMNLEKGNGTDEASYFRSGK